MDKLRSFLEIFAKGQLFTDFKIVSPTTFNGFQ